MLAYGLFFMATLPFIGYGALIEKMPLVQKFSCVGFVGGTLLVFGSGISQGFTPHAKWSADAVNQQNTIGIHDGWR